MVLGEAAGGQVTYGLVDHWKIVAFTLGLEYLEGFKRRRDFKYVLMF